jgi:hypothetical protein
MEDRSFQRVRTPVTQMGLAKGLALLPQQRARGKNKFRVSIMRSSHAPVTPYRSRSAFASSSVRPSASSASAVKGLCQFERGMARL